MQIMCEEGKVVTCNSVQCSWNEKEVCFAQSIDVGGNCPLCDTYTTDSVGGTRNEETAVSKCVMSKCQLNEQKTCNATGIMIGNHAGHADCMTYRE